MIQDFLKSLRETYTDSREKKEDELNEISTQITETKKFLDLLRKETDGSFSKFTPYHVSNKNSKKIDELNDQLGNLVVRQTERKNELADIEAWLRDIDECMAEVSHLSVVVPEKKIKIDTEKIENVHISEKDNVQSIKDDEAASSRLLQSKIKTKLEQIVGFLPADPMRARVELQALIKVL